MRAKFSSVTGADFGRSIVWARRTPNGVAVQIRAGVGKLRALDTPAKAMSTVNRSAGPGGVVA